MQYKVYILLCLLIFALLIQNTCPHGFAGKSAISASCSHCLHKQPQVLIMAGTVFGSVSHAPHHLPMYVLDIPNTQPVFRLAAMASTQPIIANSYKNTAPDEILQPPRA
jgi:hypothetical protein